MNDLATLGRVYMHGRSIKPCSDPLLYNPLLYLSTKSLAAVIQRWSPECMLYVVRARFPLPKINNRNS